MTYEGDGEWNLKFDSGTEVILTSQEIEEIAEQHEDALYKKCTTQNLKDENGRD